MHYYPETDNHIRGKVKVLLLDLSDYGTKKELEHATGIGVCNLATFWFKCWSWETEWIGQDFKSCK